MRKILLSCAIFAFSFGANLLEIYKSPSCGCCTKWGEIMSENGFEIKQYFQDDVIEIKNRFNIPLDLSSCHTALIDSYVVEGHVPADEIKRLLKLKPEGVVGISVPGMPLESPGMEQGSGPEIYDVILFKHDGSREVFATYIGSKRIR